MSSAARATCSRARFAGAQPSAPGGRRSRTAFALEPGRRRCPGPLAAGPARVGARAWRALPPLW
eukprot:5704579-Lingulodinium_polyedra.AAC.1